VVVTGRVSSDDTYVYVDPDKVAAFVSARGGPVMHDVDRRASNVQAAARRFVGKDTRRLERSIVKRPGTDGISPFVAVVTEGVAYARHHHEPSTRTSWPGNPYMRDALPFANP
jgi:hypothetical protein